MHPEIIRASQESHRGLSVLRAMEERALPLDIVMLWGVGRAGHSAHRDRAVSHGKHAVLWDMGYSPGYYRMSIDQDHPWRWLDKTPREGRTFPAELREDAGNGPIILIGMGRKSVRYLKQPAWELQKMKELKRRFPKKQIILRPKPAKKSQAVPIEQAIKGASLVVCRHSNVAVDCVIAGVPFECEDGAAYWLKDKPFTREVRQDFLNRLAHWQYGIHEAPKAWDHIARMIEPLPILGVTHGTDEGWGDGT